MSSVLVVSPNAALGMWLGRNGFDVDETRRVGEVDDWLAEVAGHDVLLLDTGRLEWTRTAIDRLWDAGSRVPVLLLGTTEPEWEHYVGEFAQGLALTCLPMAPAEVLEELNRLVSGGPLARAGERPTADGVTPAADSAPVVVVVEAEVVEVTPTSVEPVGADLVEPSAPSPSSSGPPTAGTDPAPGAAEGTPLFDDIASRQAPHPQDDPPADPPVGRPVMTIAPAREQTPGAQPSPRFVAAGGPADVLPVVRTASARYGQLPLRPSAAQPATVPPSTTAPEPAAAPPSTAAPEPTTAPETTPAANATASGPWDGDAAALVRALLPRVEELHTVQDVSELVLADAVERCGALAGAVLMSTERGWVVEAGQGLRALESRLEVPSDHWLIGRVVDRQLGLIVARSGGSAQELAGVPLASWEHLAAVYLPTSRVLVLLASSDRPFDDGHLEAVLALDAEAADPLGQAVTVRELARALLPFTGDASASYST